MPGHIIRLVALLIAFLVLAYEGKKFFTVESFFEYGHYRGASVAEIASDKPKYKGTAYCQSCHAERFAEWSSGVHNSVNVGKAVKCEVCHGPAGGRDDRGMFVHASTGPDHPANLKLAVPTDTVKLCTLCHEKMAGRPAEQRQIVVAEHAGDQQCTVCHNPHSPLLNLTSASPATQSGDAKLGKAKAEACAACHGAEGVSADLPGPTLASQSQAYLAGALKAYSTGARTNPMMSAIVQDLKGEDGENLAAYFASLKCESGLNTPASQAASKCIACHGATGKSKIPAAPNLIGQSKDYLVSALNSYKDGSRKNAMMTGVLTGLNDAGIESAAAYYANASCKLK